MRDISYADNLTTIDVHGKWAVAHSNFWPKKNYVYFYLQFSSHDTPYLEAGNVLLRSKVIQPGMRGMRYSPMTATARARALYLGLVFIFSAVVIMLAIVYAGLVQ